MSTTPLYSMCSVHSESGLLLGHWGSGMTDQGEGAQVCFLLYEMGSSSPLGLW